MLRWRAALRKRRSWQALPHSPWPLQPAEAALEVNTMAEAARIELSPDPPLLHFSKRQDVLIWSLEPLDTGA